VNVDRCSSVGIDIELALANNFNCAFCGAELISPIFNMMRESILDLIKNEQSNVILLDDDLTFHHFVKRLFNKDLVNAKYYTDGYAVLNQLTFNINYENTLPDIIFLDLNMPTLDGWDFLHLFKMITKNLKEN